MTNKERATDFLLWVVENCQTIDNYRYQIIGSEKKYTTDQLYDYYFKNS